MATTTAVLWLIDTAKGYDKAGQANDRLVVRYPTQLKRLFIDRHVDQQGFVSDREAIVKTYAG